MDRHQIDRAGAVHVQFGVLGSTTNMNRNSYFSIIGAILLTAIASAAPQTRVDTDVAMSHVLERVEPIVPPGVDTSGVEIIADVIIGTDGRVEDVKILVAPGALQKAASDALAKWKFAPFKEAGRPTSVRTIIEFKYANPKLEAERAAVNAASMAFMTCNRESESASPERAVAACAEAVRIAETLPADRNMDRTVARVAYAGSLLNAGRTDEGLDLLRRLMDERVTRVGADDADLAGGYRVIGLVYWRKGDLANADKYLTQSVASYEGALRKLPDFRDIYAPQLSQALRDLAGAKRSRGDESAAAAAEDRARAVAASVVVVAPAAVPMRSIANIICIGPLVSILTDNDVSRIQAIVSAQRGSAPWVLLTGTSGFAGAPGSRVFWPISVYLKPDVITPTLRRGQLVAVEAAIASTNDYASRQAWTKTRMQGLSYAQVPIPGRDPNDVTSDRDLNRPFEIAVGATAKPMSDDDVLAVVRLLREQAKPSGRESADVQPWAIDSIFVMESGLSVKLLHSDPAKFGGQIVDLQKQNGSWVVTRLMRVDR